MSQDSQTRSWLRIGHPASLVLIWIAVLFGESEFLAVRNYELRTEIRALLHLPLYHWTFSFLAFSGFLYYLQSNRLGGLGLGPWRKGWGFAHVGLFGLVAAGLQPLASALREQAPALKLAVWGLILLAFAGSWAAALLAPRLWIDWLRKHGPWLLVSGLLAALSLGIIRVSNWLWHPLADGTLSLAHLILAGIYDDVVVSYSQYALGTSSFYIQIEPGCSGYEGLGLVTMFTLVFLWVRRLEMNFPQAFYLLPIGWALTWLINGFRIAALVVIGSSFSPYVAMKGFHSQAGWLAFIATSTFLTLGVEWAGWFRRPLSLASSSPASEDSPVVEESAAYPAAPYLLPLLAILLGTMLGEAFSTGFPLLYPLRIVLALALMGPWWQSYRSLLGKGFSLPAVAVGLLTYLVWIALVPGKPGRMIWGLVSPELAWAWICCRVLGSSLVIPLAEELAFRGYLMRRMQHRDFDGVAPQQVGWPALLVSSLIFGWLHQDHLAGVLAGLAYATLYRNRGRLGEAVVAHGLTNFCICLQVLLLGHWSLW